MNDQLTLDLEGDAGTVLEKVATLLQGVAGDGQHVRIDAEITIEPDLPPVGEPGSPPDVGSADADLASFGVEQPGASQHRLANCEPATVPDDAERDDDGEPVFDDGDVEPDTDDTTDTSDTADTTDDGGNSSSSSTNRGPIDDDERELKEPEPGSQYHEVLAHLLQLGATNPDTAVTSMDLEVPSHTSSSPSLSSLYRYRMIDRDDSTRPYKWWINGFGLAYLNAHASEIEAFDHDHEINTDPEIGKVATDGGDDS